MVKFFDLSIADRSEAIDIAANASGRPSHLLEKDVWVVWTLHHLFAASYGRDLVFKGGTSLSKAYGAIQRFSEDVDLTYDIRALAPDLVGIDRNPLPATKSKAKKWKEDIRIRLANWVATDAQPALQRNLDQQGLSAIARAAGDKVFIEYTPLVEGTGYVKPAVMLEFGAQSTGDPSEERLVSCDAASYLPDVVFPEATPRVMRAERTFWEKATAIHVFCARGKFRGNDRFARHWYDVTRLHAAGYADAAIADKDLAIAVADHKSIFFPEKSAAGLWVNHHAAVSGGLCLVPNAEALAMLATDYQHMIDDGLFLDTVDSFGALLQQCEAIQLKANRG